MAARLHGFDPSMMFEDTCPTSLNPTVQFRSAQAILTMILNPASPNLDKPEFRPNRR